MHGRNLNLKRVHGWGKEVGKSTKKIPIPSPKSRIAGAVLRALSCVNANVYVVQHGYKQGAMVRSSNLSPWLFG